MLKKAVEPDGTVTFSDEGSSLSLTFAAPGVVVATFTGEGSFEFDKAIMDVVSDEIERSGFTSLYLDGRVARRVHPQTKEYATPWLGKHRDQLKIHVLFGSKLIEMAISVLRMLTRAPMQTYSDEKRWLEALRRDAPDFRGLPLEIRNTG